MSSLLLLPLVAELTEQARQLELDYKLAGKAVREWIRTPDLSTGEPLGSARTFVDSMLRLNKLGILLLKNGHKLDMVSDTYGTVVDSKSLVRRIPD